MNDLHNYKNKVKEKIRNGEVSIGVFLLSGSSFIAEAMANLEIDWIVIDLEASHSSKEDVLHILQALNAYDITSIIRVAEHNKHFIELSLDYGAKGIMVPKIDTPKQAEKVLKSFYYPPKGERGMNCIRASSYYSKAEEYVSNANDFILSIFQIESKESVENIFDIAQLKEVDILFIGLGDLSLSYGLKGYVTGEQMDNARKKVIDACNQYDKIPGIFCHSPSLIKQYVDEGFKFVAIGNDIKFLNQGLADTLKSFR
jgi:2-keto-3-deoxy-L-rhamnonate aldolase RhmA